MQQEVTANAASLAGEIQTSGHVAVYGIHFDTGKAVILTTSALLTAPSSFLGMGLEGPDLSLGTRSFEIGDLEFREP